MRDSSIFVGGVTLQTESVARDPQLRAVRLVAIAAGDTGSEHLALLERAVIIDLVKHLPIRMIERGDKRRDDMRIGQPLAGNPGLGELAAPRMAQAASLDLLAQGGGR